MENKIIEEQLINFETAKLASDKGFKIECNYFYNRGSNYKLQNDSIIRTGDDLIYEAPTQSLLQKWLREKHRYHIEILDFQSTEIKKEVYFVTLRIPGSEWHCKGNKQFKIYERALEFGLFELIKLIK